MLIHRHSVDFDGAGNAVQAGCRLYVDGEARCDVWEQVGPFDDHLEVLEVACGAAVALLDRQIAGQQSLLPFRHH